MLSQVHNKDYGMLNLDKRSKIADTSLFANSELNQREEWGETC